MISTCLRRITIAGLLIASSQSSCTPVGIATEQERHKWELHQDRDLELIGPDGVICRLNFNREEGKPFFHPLNALDGTTITGLRPADHPHHLGLWFSWKFLNGADYWSDSTRDGLTQVDRVSVERTTPEEAQVLLELSYRRKNEPPILKERRQMRIGVPDQNGQYRIDWDLQFEALDDVVLSATSLEKAASGGYAGLAYRPILTAKLTSAMDPEWLNSTGALDREVRARPYEDMKLHGAQADWCDMSLRFGGEGGKIHGLTIFCHPDNFRSPPWWHMAAPTGFLNPMLLYKDSWSVAKGETFRLRYRVLIHPGRGDLEQLDREYKEFVKSVPSLRAGAAAVDITPRELPVLVNGSFGERSVSTIEDPLYARCLVLEDGSERIALIAVDSCMIPRSLIDIAKKEIARATGIAMDRILISATHTHSAPSVMNDCLGTDSNPEYERFLIIHLAAVVSQALSKVQDAEIGSTVRDAGEFVYCRQWILRPDKALENPFGEQTVRANINGNRGYQDPNCIGPTGPSDPGLTLISLRTLTGNPIAVMANFSTHHYRGGWKVISADHFGRFCKKVEESLGQNPKVPPPVAIFFQGTSGDQMWMDYSKPKSEQKSFEEYSAGLAKLAIDALPTLKYRRNVPIKMTQQALALKWRVPDKDRLNWARSVLAKSDEKQLLPKIYAEQALLLNTLDDAELVLQAVRIGDLGIAAIPNEVYALTGLKIKAQSPLLTTMNIGLANGAFGYIPPPEQHFLGGYTTWPATTAGLEVEAEPKIVDTLLSLLERAAEAPRRRPVVPLGEYACQVLKSKPLAFWQMHDLNWPTVADSSGNFNTAEHETGVALYLPGAVGRSLSDEKQINRAAHYAGGRTICRSIAIDGTFTVEMWIWNGQPANSREVTGHLFSIVDPAAPDTTRDTVGIAGTSSGDRAGRLFFRSGDEGSLNLGRSEIQLKTWHHVALVRDGTRVRLYVDGAESPELDCAVPPLSISGKPIVMIGGSTERRFDFAGRIDDVAIYGRALTRDEVSSRFPRSQK
jgi:hypothetical protein